MGIASVIVEEMEVVSEDSVEDLGLEVEAVLVVVVK
jgi:hypothetical protein